VPVPTTMLSQADRRTRVAHKFRQIQTNKAFHKFSFFPKYFLLHSNFLFLNTGLGSTDMGCDLPELCALVMYMDNLL
jgi:hypothetical protein